MSDDERPTGPQRRTLNPRQIHQLQSTPTITNLGWRQIDYDPDPRPENYLPPDQPYLVGRPVYVPRRRDPHAPPEPDPYAGSRPGRYSEDYEYDMELRLRYPLPPEQEEERAKRIREQFPELKI